MRRIISLVVLGALALAGCAREHAREVGGAW